MRRILLVFLLFFCQINLMALENSYTRNTFLGYLSTGGSNSLIPHIKGFEPNVLNGEVAGSFNEIEENDSWVDSFSKEDIQELPIGVKHLIGTVEYAIGITEARFQKEYTELTVFARIRLPQTDGTGKQIELFFGADNVKLSHAGGIVGDTRLVLLGDINSLLTPMIGY
ncbi:MAG: hypothetical protein ABJN84_16550 [Flavobacteriaceae bacterium]